MESVKTGSEERSGEPSADGKSYLIESPDPELFRSVSPGQSPGLLIDPFLS
jgi:hypothetical protein